MDAYVKIGIGYKGIPHSAVRVSLLCFDEYMRQALEDWRRQYRHMLYFKGSGEDKDVSVTFELQAGDETGKQKDQEVEECATGTSTCGTCS